ncbi:MAG: phosphoadenosine phosphosulfate reductase family protein, partial [Nitrospirota bacterium]|nr:phosphoadenosine phosphosulfate reductase family protein [Nitrospirota bacterium]
MKPSPKHPSIDELQTVSHRFEGQSPQTVLAYVLEQYFPNIVLACSFGAEDVVLVDMMFRINPKGSLFYLDTDFLFPETYQVRDRIAAKYQLTPSQMIQVKSEHTPEDQAARFGERLWVY